LSQAFSVPTGFIVLKQGNWFNPQDQALTNFKTDTWCAYKLEGSKTIMMPYFEQAYDGTPPISATYCLSEVSIQLVGSQAEYMAQSIVHWPHRTDLQPILASAGMVIFPKKLGDYVVSNFIQDGLNDVLAYNTSIVIEWLNEIQPPVGSSTILTTVNLPTGYVISVPSGDYIIS
jgi:hypothetical protein